MTGADSRWFKILLVTLSFLSTFFIWGVLFTFTIYSETLSEAFSVSFTQASGLFSVTLLTFFTSLGVGGLVLTRVPIRRLLIVMSLLSGVAILALQVAISLPVLVAIYIAFGVSFGVLFVAILSLVPQWFDRWGSLALGITVSGNGVGALVMPFVWRTGITSVGIRQTFLFVGAVLVAVHATTGLILRAPEREENQGAEEEPTTIGWLRKLIAHPRFPFAFAGLGLSWAWYYVLSGHLVTILTRADIDSAVATGAFGIIGGVSIISRVLSGMSADYIGSRKVFVATLGLAIIGSSVLLYRGNLMAVYLAVTLFGIGLGGIATLTTPVLLDSYGTKNATAVVGIFNLAAGVAGFVAPSIPTIVFGGVEDYTPTILTMIAMTALGGMLFWYGTGTDRYQRA